MLPGERGEAASEGVQAPGLGLLVRPAPDVPGPGVTSLGPRLCEQHPVHPGRGVAADLQSGCYIVMRGHQIYVICDECHVTHQVLPVIVHPLPPARQGAVLSTQNTLVLPRKQKLTR